MKNFRISGFSDEMDENIAGQFSSLNALGISYFEPRNINGKNIADLHPVDVEYLKEKMEEYGIFASSIGSPIGKIRLSDDFENHFEVFKNVVDTALALGTKNIRMFSFYHDGGAWTAEETEEVVKRLRRMIAYAKENSVILLHENEKGIFGDNAERCLFLMETLSCPHFRAVFDPANFVQCHQDTKEAYKLLKPFISYMHIKDALLENGKVVPSGFGDGNVEYILRDLYRSGYDGFLSVEPHLGNFAGLEKFEAGDLIKDLPESGIGAFTLAYKALLRILERIE